MTRGTAVLPGGAGPGSRVQGFMIITNDSWDCCATLLPVLARVVGHDSCGGPWLMWWAMTHVEGHGSCGGP